MRAFSISTVTIALVVGAVATPAFASPPMFAKAKELGYPVQNCQYCHTSTVPTKETVKPEELNQRGKWLLSEKERTKANAVNVEWLKNYPAGKEQK